MVNTIYKHRRPWRLAMSTTLPSFYRLKKYFCLNIGSLALVLQGMFQYGFYHCGQSLWNSIISCNKELVSVGNKSILIPLNFVSSLNPIRYRESFTYTCYYKLYFLLFCRKGSLFFFIKWKQPFIFEKFRLLYFVWGRKSHLAPWT